MENQITQSGPSYILFDEYTKEKILGAAKTARIAALLSISGIIVGVIAFFINPNPVAKIAAKEGFDEKTVQLQGNTSLLSIIMSLLLNGVLFYFLYRFSTLTKKAISDNDNVQLSNGLFSLATYFRIWVILIILLVGLILVTVIAAGFGAAIK